MSCELLLTCYVSRFFYFLLFTSPALKKDVQLTVIRSLPIANFHPDQLDRPGSRGKPVQDGG